MTATTRRTGWLVIAVLAAFAVVEATTPLLNSEPSEGPWFCGLVSTTVAGIGWWIASKRKQDTTS